MRGRSKKQRITALGFSLALLASAAFSGCEKVHKFEGVEGPLKPSPIFQFNPADVQDYDVGETNRLAIWLTSEDSHWLALMSGLKSIGIPFRLTKDYDAAFQHDVVLVYPFISGRDLPTESFAAMRSFTQNGGTLIGTNVLGGGMQDVFGFTGIREGKDKAFLSFSDEAAETHDYISKGLAAIKIGSENDSSLNPGTNSYVSPRGEILGRYETGEAAIIANNFGQGRAYAFGIDIGQMLAKGYNRRQVDITDSYANRYRPTLDALLILLENIYKQNEPEAVTIGTVPEGKSLSFILSYDIDYSESLKNAIPYAEHKKIAGIQGTYFIQTKYIEDYNDKIFLDDEGARHVRSLERLGVEIASHSVSHAKDMWDFPLGDGTEKYPDYRPFVQTADKARNGTLTGELRVSKFLLENFAGKNDVTSFRPGFLSDPDGLPQALASTGFKYSSSVTANISMTHLPFQLTFGRGFKGFSPIYEFPITVEDELPPDMIDRLEGSKILARQISKIGGLYVVLIHTDKVDSRLDFQKALVEEVKPYAWMGSMRQFGNWWTARDQVEVDIRSEGGNLVVALKAPKPVEGLILEMPECLDIVDPGGLKVSCENGNYLIQKLSGSRKIILEK